MHSSQFTALARWADQRGATITAMAYTPGATQYADGAWLVLEHDLATNERFQLVSLHVNRHAALSYGDVTAAVEVLADDYAFVNYTTALADLHRAADNDNFDR